MVGEAFSLEVDRLSTDYGAVRAIREISLKIPRGRIVTIIGANGAGKSTFIKSVCGLVKPVSGTVRLFGEDITGLSPDQVVVRGLSVVPEGRRLFGGMTVRENLELGAYTREDAAAVKSDLDHVLGLFPDLRNRLSAATATLSGGQQQMVAVARALMSSPRVLLLDEPTIGLAPTIVDTIAETIREISRRGVDILLVEQNAEIALAVAEHGYILENGSIVTEDSAASLAQSPAVQRAYLGI